MEFLYELKPRYDRCKSFYGKTRVYRDDKGHLILMSYSTIVATIIDGILTSDGNPELKVNGYYSRTTARHINEFAQQHGFNKMSKKELGEEDELIAYA